jgi:biotin-(acetyl-CoA carboxylase) ligase
MKHLSDTLQTNYEILLTNGSRPLIEQYRRRSLVLGREVTVTADLSESAAEPLARGRVEAIGDNLELLVAGTGRPFYSGRLIL